MDPDTHPRDAAAVISVAKEAQCGTMTLQEVDPTKDYVRVDAEGRAQILDLSSLLETPTRPKGTYRPATVESFIAYVETHKDDGHTTIWVHQTDGKVLAILDDNADGATAWREHRAELKLEHTSEWKFWTEGQGLGDQEAFAEHLQEGIGEIVEPDGATLVEIAQTFQANTEVTFRKGVDITSGEVRFQYDEATEAKAGKGNVAVPKTFKLKLAPFIGEDPVEVIASLRFRTGRGKLEIGYKLEGAERIVEEALGRVAAKLDDKFKRVYRGTPAA